MPRPPAPPVHPLLPVLATLSGIALFSVMDALMKRASLAGGVYTAMLWRYVIGAAIGLTGWLVAARGRPRWPAWRVLAVHALRAAVVTPMGVLFFWGLLTTPLAMGMALSFIAPLIALYLAAALLGEALTARAQAASLLGLAGVVVIALARARESGPGGENGAGGGAALGGVLAILASALLYAVNLVLQRRQAQIASPIEAVFFQNMLSLPLIAAFAPWFGALPRLPVATLPWFLAQAAGAAALAFVSLLLLSWAYARAQAHRLLPLEYSAFGWAALMGWLWFGETVGPGTLLGVTLIVGGCWFGTRGASAQPGEQSAL